MIYEKYSINLLAGVSSHTTLNRVTVFSMQRIGNYVWLLTGAKIFLIIQHTNNEDLVIICGGALIFNRYS